MSWLLREVEGRLREPGLKGQCDANGKRLYWIQRRERKRSGCIGVWRVGGEIGWSRLSKGVDTDQVRGVPTLAQCSNLTHKRVRGLTITRPVIHLLFSYLRSKFCRESFLLLTLLQTLLVNALPVKSEKYVSERCRGYSLLLKATLVLLCCGCI